MACDETDCNTCDEDNHFIPQNASRDCICDGDNHWVANASVCSCETGYYESLNDTCLLCKAQCTACKSLTNCTACLLPTMKLEDGACKCPVGSFFVADNRTCTACQIQFCLDCAALDNCTLCDAAQNRELSADNSSCVCMKGFFEQGGACLDCGIDGCDTCVSTTNCTICKKA